MPAREVHAFWFDLLEPRDWFTADARLDRRIAAEFGALILTARTEALAYWRVSAIGRLAEILVLDQFSRNVFRDHADAFAGDQLALALAGQAVERGTARELSPQERAFLYMPFMHSESLAVHERAIELFAEPGLESHLEHEQRHRAVLERFGRYPQRNAALGRTNTAEEAAFLAEPGSGF